MNAFVATRSNLEAKLMADGILMVIGYMLAHDLVTTIKDQGERDAVIKVNAFLPYPNPYNHITSHSSRQPSTPG